MSRKRLHPVINTALQEAIKEAGWTLAVVAKAINAVAAENGLTLTYGATAVAHWLTGATPRAETVPIAVDAFARRLNLPDLTAADLGWSVPVPADSPADPWRADPVAWLIQLGRHDMLNRRSALGSGLYSLAALTIPTSPQRVLSRSGPARRSGPGDVARIRETTRPRCCGH